MKNIAILALLAYAFSAEAKKISFTSLETIMKFKGKLLYKSLANGTVVSY